MSTELVGKEIKDRPVGHPRGIYDQPVYLHLVSKGESTSPTFARTYTWVLRVRVWDVLRVCTCVSGHTHSYVYYVGVFSSTICIRVHVRTMYICVRYERVGTCLYVYLRVPT